jgi:heptosyltransferase II
MSEIRNILIVQTAFIGDVILTLPLAQACRKAYAQANVDIVVVPGARELCLEHPAIRECLIYDKRNADSGIGGCLRMSRLLKPRNYDLALIPHRSLRSAALVSMAGVPVRVGFDRGPGRFFHTKTVLYLPSIHEIDRNLSLLRAACGDEIDRELPRLYPSNNHRQRVEKVLVEFGVANPDRLVAIAPGTVWNTKRWLKERFSSLAVNFYDVGYETVLVGGREDAQLCEEIRILSGSPHVYNTAGKFSLLESAELIRRSKVLVCNDSAPMHMAAAMNTPVVAIFGATVPAFGFGPSGPNDLVMETLGLRCRPCSNHGGPQCPIKTFECMTKISCDRVFQAAQGILAGRGEWDHPGM